MIRFICQHENRDLRYLFGCSWNFILHPYSTIHNTIGRRLYHGANYSWIEELLSLRVERFYPSLLQDITELFSSHQKSGYVAIAMNAYWCPWHPLYEQQKDIQHYLFIDKIAEAQKYVYCTDPMFKQTSAFLHLEDLFRDREMLEVVVFKCIEHQDVDWNTTVQKALDVLTASTLSINRFEEIRQFALEIDALESLEAELDGYPVIATAPLLYGLNEISQNRYKYSLFLECIGNQNGIVELLLLSEEMKLASTAWGNARNLLIKASMINKKQLFQRISKKIMSIADAEELIYGKLRKLVQTE